MLYKPPLSHLFIVNSPERMYFILGLLLLSSSPGISEACRGRTAVVTRPSLKKMKTDVHFMTAYLIPTPTKLPFLTAVLCIFHIYLDMRAASVSQLPSEPITSKMALPRSSKTVNLRDSVMVVFNVHAEINVVFPTKSLKGGLFKNFELRFNAQLSKYDFLSSKTFYTSARAAPLLTKSNDEFLTASFQSCCSISCLPFIQIQTIY